MRVAVSGSHSTGKSTLIAAFLEQRPDYLHEPEAYEALADEVEPIPSEGPTPEDLEAFLRYTVSAVARHAPGACVVFERSPVDYLAYAAASRRAWPPGSATDFLKTFVPVVRASVCHLDLIALLPVSGQGPITARADEDERFRRRVHEKLGAALLEDEYDLFGDRDRPLVIELSPLPERQLKDLIRLTRASSARP
jgi:hypothetical protein